MCARYTLQVPPDLIAVRFGLPQVPPLTPRFNVAPSQMVPAVGVNQDGVRGVATFRWGFIPSWANDDRGPKPVNAKAETVAGSPVFGESLRRRRCLIPADGFYEWRTVGKKKVPIHFHRKDGAPFAFAGIWDVWPGPAGKVYTCAILTTEPNDLTRPVHDRMPAILKPEDEAVWLDRSVTDPDRLLGLVHPYPAELMEATPANPALNKAGVEGPECLAVPAGPSTSLFPD